MRMVESLWAITILVQRSVSRESDTTFCVILSRAEVASSNIRMDGLGAIALAIISLCFWPPEMPPEPSEIRVCIPMGMRSM